MPPCSICGSILADDVGLRRHTNAQHLKNKEYPCQYCGRTYLDPARRSRCHSSHTKAFGCSVQGCYYWSRRKDSAKLHIQRKHRELGELPILTLLLNPGESILQPQLDAPSPWSSSSTSSDPQTPPESWFGQF